MVAPTWLTRDEQPESLTAPRSCFVCVCGRSINMSAADRKFLLRVRARLLFFLIFLLASALSCFLLSASRCSGKNAPRSRDDGARWTSILSPTNGTHSARPVGKFDSQPCFGDRSLYKDLEDVAQHSLRSYLLEDVLVYKIQSSTCLPSNGPSIQSVLFVVVCSVDKKERLAFLHESWLSWVPPENVVLLSDGVIPGYNTTLLPALPADAVAREKFPQPDSYQQAGLRHLKSVQWLGKVNTTALAGIEWVFLVDDDTFVNIPLLLTFLHGMPSYLPVLFAYMLDAAPWANDLTYPQGGAGMLFSKPAFQQMASVLFTPECELYTTFGDMTIGSCAKPANVTKIHSFKFLPEPDFLHGMKSLQESNIRAKWGHVSPHYVMDVGMALTLHRANARQVVLHAACIVSNRFEWPLAACANASANASALCGPAQSGVPCH